MKMIKQYLMAVVLAVLFALPTSAQKIALLSDTHIQDVETHPELLRSLEEQVKSTRLFNEDIFALRAALDDVAGRGVKYIVISGDVTDDGQIVNMEAAKRILEEYETKYGMLFFVTPGNHDPSAPFGKYGFMKGILAEDGSSHVLLSDSSVVVPGYKVNFPHDEVRPDMFSVGHEGQMKYFEHFGYFPREEYLYWATPFSDYEYGEYAFEKALEESAIGGRMFTYAGGVRAYDTSYVVEPVEGIWLLSIDSGVYLPDAAPGKYKNSGPGYNNTLQHKPYLIPWVKSVCAEAKRLGKRVVAFSHYPILDFVDGASEVLSRSWGNEKLDMNRVPNAEVSQAMFDAGVRLHFAGHMHVLDSEKKTENGKSMYNVQIPSLITSVPAYRLLTMDGRHCHLETVVVKDVKGFDTFFDRYRKEMEYDRMQGREPIWRTEVLTTENYEEFCDLQFRDLVKNRFAVRDLPKVLQEKMLPLTGEELLGKVSKKSKAKKLKTQWTGLDLLTDFYRLHYSGKLALKYIPAERLKDYEVLFMAIEKSGEDSEFMNQMRDFAFAFKCFLNEKDYTDFEI